MPRYQKLPEITALDRARWAVKRMRADVTDAEYREALEYGRRPRPVSSSFMALFDANCEKMHAGYPLR